jgi:hypothetical protein
MDNIETFKERVDANKSCQFFNIIAAIGRSCPTKPWKILLLFVRLEQEGSAKADTIFENNFFKIVAETRAIASFHKFLSEIFAGPSVKLDSTFFSLDLVRFQPSLSSNTSNNYPGDYLVVEGGFSTEYNLVKEKCDLSLQSGDPPYESIDDVISDKTKNIPQLVHNAGAINGRRILLMIYAPISIRLEPASVVNDQMTIQISNSKFSKSLKVTIIGKSEKNTVTYRKSLLFAENELNKTVTIDSQSRYFWLWLWHGDELLDYKTYEIQSKELQETLWIQDIVKREDPEYKILERWITTATGSKQKT